MKKLALRILMTHLLLLLLFTGAVVATCTIPRSAIEYFHTGLVPRFPTLIVSGFITLLALMLWVAGVILEVITRNHWKQYEIMLMHHDMEHAIPHEPC